MLNEVYRMNAEEIKKYVNLLVANLSFRMDYNNLVNGSKRLLIVEGLTDEKFIKKILNDDVVCEVANKAFVNGQGLEQMSINCKNAIIRAVYGMSTGKILLKIPQGFESCSVYGLVDRDYDNSNDIYTKTPKLFVTDTHDLETLLLSTDVDILKKIEKCTISLKDTKKAFFLAYQLGLIRKVILDVKDSEFSIQAISSNSNDQIDYYEFVDDYEINVRKLIKFINNLNDGCLSPAKEKKLLEKVIKDKQLKKKLDSDTKWNDTLDRFDPSAHDDFWNVVNGHDVLSILRYINQDAAEAYSNKAMYNLNRDFENDLIDHYDYATLKNTNVYSLMSKENIVKAI